MIHHFRVPAGVCVQKGLSWGLGFCTPTVLHIFRVALYASEGPPEFLQPSLHQHAPYTLHPKPSTKPNKPKKTKIFTLV